VQGRIGLPRPFKGTFRSTLERSSRFLKFGARYHDLSVLMVSTGTQPANLGLRRSVCSSLELLSAELQEVIKAKQFPVERAVTVLKSLFEMGNRKCFELL